jgi:outer membrane protein assembly factor BamD (BamD/ComL family)
MTQARRHLAAEQPAKAKSILDAWIDRHRGSLHASLPEAHYLRGNAWLALDEEYESLYDYEEVVKNYPGSEFFAPSLEREFQVAKLYLRGRNIPSRIFGLRIDSGDRLGEEIILRIAERLPGSRLAEQSLMELADHYARTRDLRLAAETYDVFLQLFPASEHRQLAMQRRVYANIAQFKGPGYATSTLRDAKVQIDEFQEEYPDAAQRTGLSDALIARVDDSAAAGLLQNARWYLKREDTVSARLTLTRLIRRHPKTAAAQEAMEMIQAIDGSPRPQNTSSASQQPPTPSAPSE